ncbi:isocitrate lyase/PEP mutase family protein [Propionibacteriaceae bacterium G57]|uniref:isocitrate lyase/PEP mutase family protein n=1 Tax=Aestuariimicrobium sp. G57 TaxID=3418485 RepID=UPI003DA77D9E
MTTTARPPVPGIVRNRDPHELRRQLRADLAGTRPLVVPGVTDALGARLVERAGFGAMYVTGAGMSNALYGLPDIGLVSLAEVVENVSRITAAIDIPVVVDADTGHGGPLNAMRTLTQLERAGVAGIQFEDQEMPKRCGHFDDHTLIPGRHMAAKIDAAVQARRDDQLVIIARTDARSAEGSIDAAIERAHLYREAGADALFIEAPRTIEELQQVADEFRGIPLVVNVVEGGKTPQLTVEDYANMGYTFVLFANFLMRSVIHAAQESLGYLRRNGETTGFEDRIATWQTRQELVNLSDMARAEAFYDQPWGERA